jgi:hypothetical protein
MDGIEIWQNAQGLTGESQVYLSKILSPMALLVTLSAAF